MRREGRQRGWVRVYDRELLDPEGRRRRAVHVVEGQVVANGGFVRAPRKPTNKSRSGGRRALGVLAGKKATVEEEAAPQVPPPAPPTSYGYYSVGWPSSYRYGGAVVQEEAQREAARSGARTSCKGSRHKFRHHGKKMYYLDDDELDYLYDIDS